MTFEEAKAIAEKCNFSITEENGIYCVKAIGADEITAHHTSDLEDAVDTIKICHAENQSKNAEDDINEILEGWKAN